MGLMTAFISVTLKAEQGISGIGVYLFGARAQRPALPQAGGHAGRSTRAPLDIPLLDDPAVGHMFFKQNILVYAAFLLVPVLTFVLNRTTYGHEGPRRRRESRSRRQPRRERDRIRYSTVIFGSMMAGLAGATLLILDGIFQQNLTQSAGFIAVALVYFGAWRPSASWPAAALRAGDGRHPVVEVPRDHPAAAPTSPPPPPR